MLSDLQYLKNALFIPFNQSQNLDDGQDLDDEESSVLTFNFPGNETPLALYRISNSWNAYFSDLFLAQFIV